MASYHSNRVQNDSSSSKLMPPPPPPPPPKALIRKGNQFQKSNSFGNDNSTNYSPSGIYAGTSDNYAGSSYSNKSHAYSDDRYSNMTNNQTYSGNRYSDQTDTYSGSTDTYQSSTNSYAETTADYGGFQDTNSGPENMYAGPTNTDSGTTDTNSSTENTNSGGGFPFWMYGSQSYQSPLQVMQESNQSSQFSPQSSTARSNEYSYNTTSIQSASKSKRKNNRIGSKFSSIPSLFDVKVPNTAATTELSWSTLSDRPEFKNTTEYNPPPTHSNIARSKYRGPQGLKENSDRQRGRDESSPAAAYSSKSSSRWEANDAENNDPKRAFRGLGGFMQMIYGDNDGQQKPKKDFQQKRGEENQPNPSVGKEKELPPPKEVAMKDLKKDLEKNETFVEVFQKGSSDHQMKLIRKIGIKDFVDEAVLKKWKCLICSVITSGPQSYASHCSGRRHRQRMTWLSSKAGEALRNTLRDELMRLPDEDDFEETLPKKRKHHVTSEGGIKSVDVPTSSAPEQIVISSYNPNHPLYTQSGYFCKPCGKSFFRSARLHAHLVSPEHEERKAELEAKFGTEWQEYYWYNLSKPPIDLQEQDPIGTSFVVPVSGFFCKLCCKFYNSEVTAKNIHCRQQYHHLKVGEWQRTSRNQDEAAVPVNGRKLEKAMKDSDLAAIPAQQSSETEDVDVVVISDAEDGEVNDDDNGDMGGLSVTIAGYGKEKQKDKRREKEPSRRSEGREDRSWMQQDEENERMKRQRRRNDEEEEEEHKYRKRKRDEEKRLEEDRLRRDQDIRKGDWWRREDERKFEENRRREELDRQRAEAKKLAEEREEIERKKKELEDMERRKKKEMQEVERKKMELEEMAQIEKEKREKELREEELRILQLKASIEIQRKEHELRQAMIKEKEEVERQRLEEEERHRLEREREFVQLEMEAKEMEILEQKLWEEKEESREIRQEDDLYARGRESEIDLKWLEEERRERDRLEELEKERALLEEEEQRREMEQKERDAGNKQEENHWWQEQMVGTDRESMERLTEYPNGRSQSETGDASYDPQNQQSEGRGPVPELPSSDRVAIAQQLRKMGIHPKNAAEEEQWIREIQEQELRDRQQQEVQGGMQQMGFSQDPMSQDDLYQQQLREQQQFLQRQILEQEKALAIELRTKELLSQGLPEGQVKLILEREILEREIREREMLEMQERKLLQERMQMGVQQESMQTGVLQEGMQTGASQESMQTGALQEMMQTGVLQERMQTGALQERMQTGALQERMQTGALQERMQTGSLQERMQTGALHERMQTGALQEIMQTGALQERMQTGALQERMQTGAPQERMHTGALQERMHTGALQERMHTGALQERMQTGAPQERMQTAHIQGLMSSQRRPHSQSGRNERSGNRNKQDSVSSQRRSHSPSGRNERSGNRNKQDSVSSQRRSHSPSGRNERSGNRNKQDSVSSQRRSHSPSVRNERSENRNSDRDNNREKRRTDREKSQEKKDVGKIEQGPSKFRRLGKPTSSSSNEKKPEREEVELEGEFGDTEEEFQNMIGEV